MIGRIRRAAAAAALALSLFAAAPSVAAPPPGPTAIVIDLDDGAVLEARDVDALRKPASIAKLMTVFLAFDAIASGEIDETAAVEISSSAAGQPPVKAWFKAGERAPFIELIAATAIASSNDAAVAVAEAVAGDEKAFVDQMNRRAEALGMLNTRYGSASGLPAAPAQTTARDVALLARALIVRHGERLPLLSQASVSAGGRRLSTTNPLIGSYVGAKGLKTGFTCAAGYALAALAERDGRRVLAVALGHPSKADRDASVRRLLDRAFGVASPPQEPAHAIDVGATAAPIAVAAPRRAPRDVAAAQAARVAAAPSVLEPATRVTDGPTPSVRACARGGLRGWGALVGVYRTRRAANAAASQIAGGEAYVFKRRRDGKWISVKHAMNRAGAIKTCQRARRAGRYCLTLPPTVLTNPRARWR